MLDPRLTRCLALVVGAAVSGACATTRYTQSQIEALPRDVEGRTGSEASIEIEGLKVGILALDRAPEQEAIPSLTLRLVFEPDELGYSFDPGQVLLRTVDGRESRARGGGYAPLYPNATFELAFDVAVEPETRAELVLGGLARGRRRLEPVTLSLARRRGRSIDRMYWLEAIGLLLVGPYAGM